MGRFASGTVQYRVMVTDYRPGRDNRPYLWEDDVYATAEEARAAIDDHVGGYDDDICYSVIESWSPRAE